MDKVLDRSFFQQNTLQVAKNLLGKYLVYNSSEGLKKGIVVETEAYRGVEDLACHASWRKRESCRNLWGEAGHLYVYLTYGIHWMINVVTQENNFPSAVLIRGLEPREGIFGTTNGPGKLSKALGVNSKEFDGLDVTGKTIFFSDSGYKTGEIIETTRIGVEYAKKWAKKPWRFYIAGNKFVSRI